MTGRLAARESEGPESGTSCQKREGVATPIQFLHSASGCVLLNGQTRSGRSFRLRPAKKNGQAESDRVWPVKKNAASIAKVALRIDRIS